MAKSVLVTGAAGFIGSHLAERLVRDGHRVRAFVRYNGRDDRGHLDDLEPAVRDGRIYARGVADNKGQHLAQIIALEAHMAVHGRLPCNVVLLLEGEEEVGSPHIAAFVAENRELLRLVRDREERKRMGEEALKSAARYDLSLVTERWESFLDERIAAKRARTAA